jgi:SOS-response transcriptional repressor LexA
MNLQEQQIRQTLELLLQLHDLTEAELARRSKMPQPTIHRLLTGATPDPRLSTLLPLAEFFDITINQLVGAEPLPQLSRDISGTRKLVKLPLIPWDKAADWQKIIGDYIPANWQYWTTVTTDNKPSPNSFALIIEVKDMPPPFGYNSVLILDPDFELRHGSYVVIHRISDQSTTIKKLQFEGAEKWLVPLNEKIAATLYSEDYVICGTITQANVPLSQ